MQQVRKELKEYDNLPGGESAGAATSALSAGGQPAGLVVDAALVEGASGSAAPPPPPPLPAADVQVLLPPPPPPECPPPDVVGQLFGPDEAGSALGGEVLKLPSQVFGNKPPARQTLFV